MPQHSWRLICDQNLVVQRAWVDNKSWQGEPVGQGMMRLGNLRPLLDQLQMGRFVLGQATTLCIAGEQIEWQVAGGWSNDLLLLVGAHEAETLAEQLQQGLALLCTPDEQPQNRLDALLDFAPLGVVMVDSVGI
ncbi:MAG: hypothetical protein HC915_20770, partial [Anaerolineae bacterium]|nr:hypothetical protein [Anaerolineae bacterium]